MKKKSSKKSSAIRFSNPLTSQDRQAMERRVALVARQHIALCMAHEPNWKEMRTVGRELEVLTAHLGHVTTVRIYRVESAKFADWHRTITMPAIAAWQRGDRSTPYASTLVLKRRRDPR